MLPLRTALLPTLVAGLLLGAMDTQALQTLTLHGSNTIGEKLAPNLLNAWLEQQGCKEIRRSTPGVDQIQLDARCADEDVRIQVHAFGTGTGFAELNAGRADIWMASRPVNAAELAQSKESLRLDSPEREQVIALDGLSVIVHPANPLRALNVAQLRALFSGQVQQWESVGGPDRPIHLYARDDKSGTFDSFKSMVLAGAPLATAAQRFESSAELSERVAADPDGIGFVGLAAVGKARALAIADGESAALEPRPQQVAVEDYPLSRRLYLYSGAKLSVFGIQFLQFVQTVAGQKIVDQTGFVGLNVRPVQLALPAKLAPDYQLVTTDADRLGLNFRFSESTAALDSRAARDVERLVRFMQQPENTGRSLRLAGFADSREMPYAALALSTDRADYIAMLLNRAGVAVTRVRGLGQALPVADNQTGTGRARNRRVEVWLAADEGRGSAGASAGY